MLYGLTVVFFTYIQLAVSVHDSLNFILHPGHTSCFYEHFETGSAPRTIDAYVQSSTGANIFIHGPLTLDEIRSETFASPPILVGNIDSDKESHSETQSYTKEFLPKLEGTYGICLDNSQTSFLDNNVQLDVRKGPKETKYAIVDAKSKPDTESILENNKDDALLKSLESVSRLRKGMVDIQIQQLHDRRRLNLFSLNNKTSRNEMIIASTAETAVFILAAIFQIYFVRNWFAKRAVAIQSNGNVTGSTKLSA